MKPRYPQVRNSKRGCYERKGDGISIMQVCEVFRWQRK